MAESKLAKFRAIKCHPLAFHHSRNPSNKVTVKVYPKVVIRKKHRRQQERQRSNIILNFGNPFEGLSQTGNSAYRESNYLEVHFYCASAVGAAPYRFEKDSSIKWKLKGPYFVINSLAMLDNLCIIWESVQDAIMVNSSTSIATYVDIGKSIGFVMLRIVHMISLWKDADKYRDMLEITNGTFFSAELRDPKKAALSVGVFIVGLIRALSRSLTGITLGAQFMLFGHCGRIITKFVKDWDAPENIDWPCGLLGGLGFLTTLSGGIIQQAALTGPLMAAATLLSACKAFKYKPTTTTAPPGIEIGTGNVNNNVPHGGLQLRKRYGELKKISKAINRAFSPILKLLLLANLFMFASLIDNMFNGSIAKGKRAWMLFDAVLACVFLYLANAIGNMGGRFREWLKVDQNRVQVGMSELNVIQEELSSQSIGIGRETFFINDGFLVGYAGAIVAYFFGIVETRPVEDT